MEARVNYTAVGLFIVVLGIALISFAFWLGKHNQDDKEYRLYSVYITESVSGLAPEAAVKFHGVDVGKVESIRINPLNSEEVELLLKIKKETPIKTDSSAILKFYGITGLAFIEIAGGSKTAPLLIGENDAIPTIPTRPSLIQRLDESLSNVASKLSVTLDRADRLFSDRNIHNVAQTLEHLRSLSAQIEGYQSQIQTILDQTPALQSDAADSLHTMKEAATGIKTTTESADALIKTKLSPLLNSLQATSQESRVLIHKLEASLERGDYDLRSIAAPADTEIRTLLEETRTLMSETETSLRTLRENPSGLLFKKSTPKPGPGE
jgi:phospholipid/cholesterol/gamma-HCH transport system substrate-binding protein